MQTNVLLQWSFGVTMWEIFTCGKVPYNGIHAMGILPELERGAVLEIPDNKACSDDVSVFILLLHTIFTSKKI